MVLQVYAEIGLSGSLSWHPLANMDQLACGKLLLHELVGVSCQLVGVSCQHSVGRRPVAERCPGSAAVPGECSLFAVLLQLLLLLRGWLGPALPLLAGPGMACRVWLSEDAPLHMPAAGA